jgi:hypothetical protein
LRTRFPSREWIRQDLAKGLHFNIRLHRCGDYALFAELMLRESDQSKANEKLSKAIDVLKECGADGWVEKYEKEFAKL